MSGKARKGKSGVRRGGQRASVPDAAQRDWLRRGLDQPGGKLPLFDAEGQRIDAAIVRSCLKAGWAVPWFENPLKPDWQVCRLTEAGRACVTDGHATSTTVSVVIPVPS